MTKVCIVYFIWARQESKYLDIIQGQIYDIIESQILEVSQLHLVISGTSFEIVKEMIMKLLPKGTEAFFYEHKDNQYEYYGILKLYELGQLHIDKFLVYIHSKGMSLNMEWRRHAHNIVLTRHTLWR